MSSSRWKKLHAAITCTFVLLTGCVTQGERTQEAQAAMVGTPQRKLLTRLGPPDELHIAAERRYFIYRLDLRKRQGFPGPPEFELAFCDLLFRIDSGVVADVRVRGVSQAGLNADMRCTIFAGEIFGAGRSGREVPREAFTEDER